MHESVLAWGARIVAAYGLDIGHHNVLEVGSQDVNGSFRDLFKEVGSYVGIDQQAGPGVDVVCDATEAANMDIAFDVVVSTELLEHCDRFWLALEAMGAALRPGGWLLLTARGWTPDGRAMFEHSYPHDYWRFGSMAVPLLVELAGCDLIETDQDHQAPGFMALGRRRAR
jgi:SAM-dependent methyltransferase